MNKHKTTVRVGNRFLTPEGIGRNNLDIHDCLAELVANSLDWNCAKIDNSDVKIRLILNDDYIELIDNGAGMNREELDSAINLAEAEDSIRDRLDEQERKGMYGMGLKIAALSLGWKFSIHTVSFKDPKKEFYFEFDSENLKNPESKYLEDELFIIEKERGKNSPISDFSHGTSIKIEKLEKSFDSYVAIKERLQDSFLPDINNLIEHHNLEFKVVKKSKGVIIDALRMEKTNTKNLFFDPILKLDFENPDKFSRKNSYFYEGKNGKKFQLRGYLQLLKNRSVKDQKFGLNLYYNGQLIERYHKGKLLSINGRRREMTYGELHLDGCTPDPSKKKFMEDNAFNNVKELIRDDLSLYGQLSPTSKDQKKLVQKEIDKRKGIKPQNIVEKDDEKKNKDNEPNEVNEDSDKEYLAKYPEGTIKIDKRLYIQITKEWIYEREYTEDRGVNWDSAYITSKEFEDLKILKVYINPSSQLFKSVKKLYQKKSDQNKILTFYKKIAICECIYDKLIEVHSFSMVDAREIVDKRVYPQVLELSNLK